MDLLKKFVGQLFLRNRMRGINHLRQKRILARGKHKEKRCKYDLLLFLFRTL